MNDLVKALCIAAMAALAAPTAAQAQDILLCIDGVQGGSAVEDPKDCIDVRSWSWGMERPVAAAGSGRTRASVDVGDLVVVKEAERASPALLLGTLRGENFSAARLIVSACAGSCDTGRVPLVTLSMTDVVFTRLEMGGTEGTAPTESLSLNFEALEYCYQEIERDGSAGGEFCSQYSIAEGK